ncbi:unnamed protein product [Cylindrotheca closterium]|uniref:Endoplasmic reticulum oxidoreductin 1 n=1 Tax=Cylindrotheca closterium TaxID=2856 RepID=A0AAD2JQ28_9STRA|nr:unnamed protein product [Cylindrotheca closterium]
MKTALVAASLLQSTVGFSTTLKSANVISLPGFKTGSQPVSRCSSALPSTISSNDDLLPGISAIGEANGQLSEQLEGLSDSNYFRLYCVDILASCEYMPQELFECYSETCEVYPIDDDEIPERLRTHDYNENEFEIDGWARWDMPSNDYYDLEQFPEGYTAYDGSSVWNYIHSKICFQNFGYDDDHWKADFNKAVSGLHSVVSAQVIRGINDKVASGEAFGADEVWTDPKAEFARRMGSTGETPLAVENLYFTYMILLSAVGSMRGKLMQDCDAGVFDAETASFIKTAISLPIFDNPAIGVAAQKLSNHAVQSPGDLWEARMRSRELLRIVNCVQCNKCRLHGKIAMMGLSTALQVLVGGPNGKMQDPNQIRRVELAALVTTLYKASKAIKLCQQMTV